MGIGKQLSERLERQRQAREERRASCLRFLGQWSYPLPPPPKDTEPSRMPALR